MRCLKRDIDLVLRLPLRYEEQTRIVKLRDAREWRISAAADCSPP
jgi:hypothetical protein